MIDTTVDVINKLGLHARASGKLIEVTTKFRSSIQIGKGDKLVALFLRSASSPSPPVTPLWS